MEALVVYFLLANTLLALVVAYAAEQKGRSGIGFFALAFFLSFLVAMLVLLAIPRGEEDLRVSEHSRSIAFTNEGTKVKCPYCAEWINFEALVCKHCQRDVQAEIARILQMAEQDKAAAAAERQRRTVQAETARALRRAAIRNSPLVRATLIIAFAGVILHGLAGAKTVWDRYRLTATPESFEELRESWFSAIEACVGVSVDGIEEFGERSRRFWRPINGTGWAIEMAFTSDGGGSSASLVLPGTLPPQKVECVVDRLLAHDGARDVPSRNGYSFYSSKFATDSYVLSYRTPSGTDVPGD